MEQKISTIARDENCDMYSDANGSIVTVEAKEAYAQIINAKMRTSLGELQLAMQKGVPYFQTVFQDAKYAPIWEENVIRMLDELPFVKEVTSFDCEIDGDVLKYVAEIETDNGVVTING